MRTVPPAVKVHCCKVTFNEIGEDVKSESYFRKAAELIKGADALIFGAGAGMGVDSGLPDFRSNNGFWKAYPALAAAQMDFTEVASPRTFEKDPRLAWGFYGHRLKMYRETVPHEGFAILKEWAEAAPLGALIYTSNVDGAFQKAGFSEDHVHECHGSIHCMQCMEQCISGTWPADSFVPLVDEETCRLMNALPMCPVCGGLSRPNIVMFGDWNWNHIRREGQRARETSWLNKVTNGLGNVAIIELGAGTAIPSVRHFSHRISKEYGARIIRINPREFEVPSSKDVGIPMGALEALRGIQAAFNVLSEPETVVGTFVPQSIEHGSAATTLRSQLDIPLLTANDLAQLDCKRSIQSPAREGASETYSIQFQIDARPLRRLIDDAARGLRVYELMALVRPRDLIPYMWVTVKRSDIGIAAYARETYKTWARGPREVPDSLEIALEEFDRYFFFQGWDTDDWYYIWLKFRDSELWASIFVDLMNVIQKAQAVLRTRQDFLLQRELARIDGKSHHCDHLSRPTIDGRLVDRTEFGDDVDSELFELIMGLAKLPRVKSVSCPFEDVRLWRALVAEQVRRADLQGIVPELALELNGPDGGIPDISGSRRMYLDWGGEIHIPYEGTCPSTLLIQPPWWDLTRSKFDQFSHPRHGSFITIGSTFCKYFVCRQLEIGDIPQVSRTVIGTWAVYSTLDVTVPGGEA